ncbi:MAG TPA: 7,8-didemethyl-8-hydroxy-5-deazariboflavin synthase CofG [Candidatus Limnocylindrales bacterium]|nr:7,8-didemethyl-8-hydroxy-5-deazariboflavin synthase CofG [Candidatus Limnocylindrales bacterium]
MANPADIALEKAARLEPLDDDDAYALLQIPASDLPSLCEIAGASRDSMHGRTLTYSPKVFLPVTNLCRDRCSYCTFRRDPEGAGEWTMTPDEIRDWSRRGHELGCIEALMCLGDKPEIAFRGFRDFLETHGVGSTAEYVELACSVSLAEGLLPHTNAGLLSKAEMERLRPLNVSMGLMLENISPRLRDRGMPHHHAPDKEPVRRLRMIREAGQLAIPFTSGILVGIGETEAERVASLLALRRVHGELGHIQEIIVQNFRAKECTGMAGAPELTEDEMVRTVALARIILGPQMNLQAPPNLSPDNLVHLIRAGINDWGGISPLTKDYVNPEAAWPAVTALRALCNENGFTLEPRLPVYDEYLTEDWMAPEMLAAAEGVRSRRGFARIEGAAS